MLPSLRPPVPGGCRRSATGRRPAVAGLSPVARTENLLCFPSSPPTQPPAANALGRLLWLQSKKGIRSRDARRVPFASLTTPLFARQSRDDLLGWRLVATRCARVLIAFGSLLRPLARPPSFTSGAPCGVPWGRCCLRGRRCSALARLRPVPGSVTRSLVPCGCCCVLPTRDAPLAGRAGCPGPETGPLWPPAAQGCGPAGVGPDSLTRRMFQHQGGSGRDPEGSRLPLAGARPTASSRCRGKRSALAHAARRGVLRPIARAGARLPHS